MAKLLFACVLFLFAFAPRAHAAECIEFSSGVALLSQPGNYCMSGKITANLNTGALVIIDSDDVVLDCRGFTLRNTSTMTNNNAYAVLIENHRNVRVKNCRIAGGFAAGIYAYQDNGLANTNQNLGFIDNTISGAYFYGILAYGTDIEIRGNRIHDIGGRATFAMGIRTGGSTLAGEPRTFRVEGNFISDVASPVNNAYGIYGNNTSGSTYVDNTIIDTFALSSSYKSYGVYLFGGEFNKIRGNHILGQVQSNDLGIYTAPGGNDDCYHNHIRRSTATLNCLDALGNY